MLAIKSCTTAAAEDKRSLDKLCLLFLTGTLLLLAFVNVPSAMGAIRFYIPHISGLFLYWHMFFIVATVLMIMLKCLTRQISFRVDVVTILLTLRCIWDIISYALNQATVTEGYWGYYATTIISLIAYFICLQMRENAQQTYKYFAAFGIVLSAQVIGTAILAGVPYLSIYYKGTMAIPFASSNVISSALVPLFFLTFYVKAHKRFQLLYGSVLLLGIILTKSRGGMILFIISIVGYFFITSVMSSHHGLKKPIIILLIGIVLIYLFSLDAVKEVFMGYADTLNFNALTSGRLHIFVRDLMAGFERPIFGHGLGYGYTNISGAHNLLIDLFYKCGSVGFFTYTSALIILIGCAYKNKAGKASFFFLFILIMLANSMFEVCYFTDKCDVLFWSAAGLLMSEIKNDELLIKCRKQTQGRCSHVL